MRTVEDPRDRLRRATFKIRIERNPDGVWEWGTGFFISRTGYALTAFHNVPEHVRESGGGIDAYYRGKWITLECLVAESLREDEGDIALLRWQGAAIDSPEHLPIARVRLDVPRQDRSRLWAGRPVCIFGYPIAADGQGEWSLDGTIHSAQPYTEVDRKSHGGVGPAITGTTEWLQIHSIDAAGLEGISGAPVLDLETGCVVAVQHSYRPEHNVVYVTEIGRLTTRGSRIEQLPDARVLAGRREAVRHSLLPARVAAATAKKPVVAVAVGLAVVLTIGAIALLTWQGQRVLDHPRLSAAEASGVGRVEASAPPGTFLDADWASGVATISLREVPPQDCGGPSRTERIAGTVHGVRPPDHRLIIYAFTCAKTWFVQPSELASRTLMDNDGRFEANIHLGLRYGLLLVPASYEPSAHLDELPSASDGVIAVAIFTGRATNTAAFSAAAVPAALDAASPQAPLSAEETVVMEAGRLTPGFDMGVNSSRGRADWVTSDAEEMVMAYPAGQDWGAIFVTVGPPRDTDRPGRDFSALRTLVVEMRGEQGGEVVELGLKDNTDPDDGSETKTRVVVSREWQSFEFPLSMFRTADLRRLYVVTEFVFGGPQAATVSVRRIALRR